MEVFLTKQYVMFPNPIWKQETLLHLLPQIQSKGFLEYPEIWPQVVSHSQILQNKKNISENGCSSSQRSDPLWSLYGFELRSWGSGWWRRHCCPGEDHKVHCSEQDVMVVMVIVMVVVMVMKWFFTSSKVPEEETTQAPANVKQENVKNRFK